MKRIFEDYISGEYDGIEIPRHADDRLQRIYLQGYNQAIRDMKEFINLKRLIPTPMSNSQNLTKTHNLIKPKYTKEVNYGRNNRGK